MSTLYYKGKSYTPSEVEANPSGDPTDTLETIGIGGVNYGIAGGNVYGAFIDTNRVIQDVITVQGSTPIEYTATEDCGVIYTVTESGSNQSIVYINDIMVKLNVGETVVDWLYLRKGDNFKITGMSAKNYTVYSLTFGTNNIFTPQIYSLEEREIGIWIDGKPLYQKTYSLTTPIIINGGGTWINTGIDISNVDYLIDAEFGIANAKWDAINAVNDSGVLKAVILASGSLTVSEITILYTKTTDTPGSGNWTPSGIPAHHYSTNEQVIGTWIDGSTVYEKTIDLGSETSFSNGWQSIIPHNNDYNLVFKGMLINEDGISYQLDMACNDTTYLEGYFTHSTEGRFLTFQYTKTT